MKCAWEALGKCKGWTGGKEWSEGLGDRKRGGDGLGRNCG